MVLTLCFQVGLMRFFGRAVVAQPARFSLDGDAGAPLVLEPDDAQEPRLVAPIGASDVLRVSVGGDHAQIAQSVVVFAPVNVVYEPIRPNTVDMQPRKPMRFVNFSAQAYRNVAKFIGVACNVASTNCFAGPLSPSKNSCAAIVRQHFTNVFGGNLWLSHAASPLSAPTLARKLQKAQSA